MVLASELDLDTLLHRIADLSREVIGASYGAVGVLGDAGELLRFVYSGIDEETAHEIGDLPHGTGVLGALIVEGRPLRLREISDHPRSYGFPPHHPPMHSFLGVPIIVRGKTFGRLYLTEKMGSPEFSKDDERIALTLASQAGIAIENARLYEEIRTRGEQLAILEERERIAKDLHDGVIQSIYSVGLSLQGSLGLVGRDEDVAKRRIDDAIVELDNVVRDVRSYIFELQPKSVAAQGLRDAIIGLVKDFEVNTLATVSMSLPSLVCDQIPEDDWGDLVQIVREILSNVARHAEASEVKIELSSQNAIVVLHVTDDGIGFDPERVKRGHGLKNMEERARKLGGSMSIVRNEPRGTRHTLRVPPKGRERRWPTHSE